MSRGNLFPRWASPPGDTIRDALKEKGIDPHSLATELEFDEPEFDEFLAGDIPLTIRGAECLTSALGGSIEFWITRDVQYRQDRARVAADSWAQQLPVKEMTQLGWIEPRPKDWVGQLDACLQFFDVATPEDWRAGQAALESHTHFRSSTAVSSDGFAVATWLRQCDIQLSKVDCKSWDQEAFAALLPKLLSLTRERDPRRFLPDLEARCAEVGVAVGIIRAPTGCPVSGAARLVSSGQPSIALSGRYRADDHLWFTFFHEAAHLLLHSVDELYVDVIEPDSSPRWPGEAEADEFAGTMLVPTVYEERVAQAKDSPFALKKLADEIGVGVGILIGHLQHRGVLGYASRLNRLKRRYQWDGPNLEMA